jgi:hypothetical protein
VEDGVGAAGDSGDAGGGGEMRISEHWILILGLLMMAVGFVLLHRLIGPQNEPAACEVGPMEAAQCRAAGLERQPNGEWK